MNNESRWVTLKDGRRIKINDYMNDKIRRSKKDTAVHFGNLGKARDTYYWNMESSNRSTGHFGTGTYFLSEEEAKRMLDSPFFSRADRPQERIDFNKYNLFKPATDTEAYILHTGLKAINYLRNFDTSDFDRLQDVFEKYGIDRAKTNKAYYKAREVYYSDKYQNASYDSELDSLSTIFMKELGFNGIDVRGLEQYDNTTYGSVIYDLNKKRS